MTPEQIDKAMALADAFADQLGTLCAASMGSPEPEHLAEAMMEYATDRAALHDYLLSTIQSYPEKDISQPKQEPLTDQRIRELQAQYPSDNDPMALCRAVEREIRGKV